MRPRLSADRTTARCVLPRIWRRSSSCCSNCSCMNDSLSTHKTELAEPESLATWRALAIDVASEDLTGRTDTAPNEETSTREELDDSADGDDEERPAFAGDEDDAVAARS